MAPLRHFNPYNRKLLRDCVYFSYLLVFVTITVTFAADAAAAVVVYFFSFCFFFIAMQFIIELS